MRTPRMDRGIMEDDGDRPSWIRRLRESKSMVVLVVFMALMLDVMLMTSIDPILPAMLRTLDPRYGHKADWWCVADGHVTCHCPSAAKHHCVMTVTDVSLEKHAGQPEYYNDTKPGTSDYSWKDCRVRGNNLTAATCSNSTTISNIELVNNASKADLDFSHYFEASCNRSVNGTRPKSDVFTPPSHSLCPHEARQNVSCMLGNLTKPRQGEHTALTPEVGLIVAAKPATELVANILVGYLVDWVGHQYPMIIGCLFNFVSTIGFAYAQSFSLLLITRVLQAIGSSLSVVAGLAFLSAVYTDDADRAKANSKAFSGISLGIILGYPYGSVVYQFFGREAPFLILAALTLLDGALRVILVSPKKKSSEKQSQDISAMCRLASDGLIMIGLGSVFLIHVGLGLFLATGPAWMLDALHAQQWNIGMILAVAVVFHFTAQCVTGYLAVKFGRWLFCLFGMLFFAVGLALYPLCENIWQVLGPEISVRIGHGTVLCVISPLLSHLTDLRHGSMYGAVYGLYTASYNLGISVGSVVGGQFMMVWPFKRLYWTMGGIIALYSLTSLAYRPPAVTCTEPLKETPQKQYGTMETSTKSRDDAVYQGL